MKTEIHLLFSIPGFEMNLNALIILRKSLKERKRIKVKLHVLISLVVYLSISFIFTQNLSGTLAKGKLYFKVQCFKSIEILFFFAFIPFVGDPRKIYLLYKKIPYSLSLIHI